MDIKLFREESSFLGLFALKCPLEQTLDCLSRLGWFNLDGWKIKKSEIVDAYTNVLKLLDLSRSTYYSPDIYNMGASKCTRVYNVPHHIRRLPFSFVQPLGKYRSWMLYNQNMQSQRSSSIYLRTEKRGQTEWTLCPIHPRRPQIGVLYVRQSTTVWEWRLLFSTAKKRPNKCRYYTWVYECIRLEHAWWFVLAKRQTSILWNPRIYRCINTYY